MSAVVVIVTGASRGIGRGIALELARIGYDLVINYAGNKTAARKTAAMNGDDDGRWFVRIDQPDIQYRILVVAVLQIGMRRRRTFRFRLGLLRPSRLPCLPLLKLFAQRCKLLGR